MPHSKITNAYLKWRVIGFRSVEYRKNSEAFAHTAFLSKAPLAHITRGMFVHSVPTCLRATHRTFTEQLSCISMHFRCQGTRIKVRMRSNERVFCQRSRTHASRIHFRPTFTASDRKPDVYFVQRTSKWRAMDNTVRENVQTYSKVATPRTTCVNELQVAILIQF